MLKSFLLVDGLAGLVEGDFERLVDGDDALLLHLADNHSGLEILSGRVFSLLEILSKLLELGELLLGLILLLRGGEVVSLLLLVGPSALLAPMRNKLD